MSEKLSAVLKSWQELRALHASDQTMDQDDFRLRDEILETAASLMSEDLARLPDDLAAAIDQYYSMKRPPAHGATTGGNEADEDAHRYEGTARAQGASSTSYGKFETKDSGEKAQHADGVQRDTQKGKPMFGLMFPRGVDYEDQMLTRLAYLYARGAEKYGDRNWENVSSQETLDHNTEAFLRHAIKFVLGMEDEDHAAAVMWNVNAIELGRKRLREQASPGVQSVFANVRASREDLATKPSYEDDRFPEDDDGKYHEPWRF